MTNVTNFTLLDGGMGRELERMGAPFRQPEWSALALKEAPQYVLRAHQNFIAAGADIITTNAYAVVPFHIGDERFNKDGFALARQAAQISREAADQSSREIRVAGCLPPLFGSYKPDNFDAYLAQEILDILIKAQEPYVDLWLGETLSCTDEARAVAQALKPSPKDLWLSFNTMEKMTSHSPARLRSGESIEDTLAAAKHANARAILFNCNTPEDTDIAIKTLSRLEPAIAFGAYANMFSPVREAVEANAGLNASRDDLGPDRYTAFVKSWLDAGATIVGGCCGIGPEHISKLHELRPS